MRRVLFAALPFTVLFATFLAACSADRETRFPDDADADSLFAAEVVPVLRDQCESCHFAGGEMYPTFPFDRRTAVEARSEEIAERLEGRGRRTMIAWIRWYRARESS